ncbi:hypothetical protein [Aestuariibacter salexigens]|uniref:hypothetical protein n=1 Tax=Aestuariibacter salexigens TaxID=226010 RepID=UPI0003FF4215|nr:hypothetical protein [Aestuariibacter salexigens]
MSEVRKTAVVICPGRGTYNPPELGYLHRYGVAENSIEPIEHYRKRLAKPGVIELDQSQRYQPAIHTKGEHASALIYACSVNDFAAIETESIDIVAITGNSMGWYTTLSLAGALSAQHGIELVDTMGSMMQSGIIGGQLIYPVVDENWRYCEARASHLNNAMQQVNQQFPDSVFLSIRLGGYRVIGGSDDGLKLLLDKLEPVEERYPLSLPNHAAFHTPLLERVSAEAKQKLSAQLFNPPTIPMIDGRGHIWRPYATDPEALWDYTLGEQVTHTYDYSRAVEVALKEFAPDMLITLGPGSTLGGATAQCLIAHQWHELNSKQAFLARQESEPLLLSMGIEAQRNRVSKETKHGEVE